MKRGLWSVTIGAVVLVTGTVNGTTGALWRDWVEVDAGIVKTGSLELLAGGQPETHAFDALNASNLSPGQAVSAPLTITNSGSTDLLYALEGVSTGSEGTATRPAADVQLASALSLSVTNDASCDGAAAGSGTETLYQGPLTTAAFTGSQLAPASSAQLCITVSLSETAPVAASGGAVRSTFVFRGDQVR